MTAIVQRTIAEHQIGFRDENETIQKTADGLALIGPIPFVCECPELACREIVHLTFDEYESVRANPRHFFNVPGHEQLSVDAGAEVVLVVLEKFAIVHKVGLAGHLAQEASGSESDPRP